MDTNSFTMYLTLIVLGLFIINNLYKQLSLSIAKAKGAIYHKLPQEEAIEQINNNKNIVILDVRTPNEFKSGHIKKAKNISILREIIDKYPDKTTKMFLYCQSGSRSIKTAKKLVMKGYKEIYDIGGLSYWNYGTTKK